MKSKEKIERKLAKITKQYDKASENYFAKHQMPNDKINNGKAMAFLEGAMDSLKWVLGGKYEN